MINYSNTQLGPLAIHYVGKKSQAEGFNLSEQVLELDDEYKESLLCQYLLGGFKEPSFYNFDIALDTHLPHALCESYFKGELDIMALATKLTEQLYEESDHPSIKRGELVVCYFEDLILEDEVINAIGIFKVETRSVFLQLVEMTARYDLKALEGLALNGLDKGCLVFNTDVAQGYKICMLDKGATAEAKFWSDQFLKLKESSDAYHHTTHYIKLTKDFIGDQQKSGATITKGEELEIMSASQKFFEANENFTESNYLESVFGNDQEVQSEFRNFKQSSGAPDLVSEFEISEPAVKKNSKFFRSVIKLDKNFHIYVHGDKNKIERGTDEMGRKFYKFYYEEES